MKYKNKERDLAIIALLLASGVRLSEAVNLDLRDLNLKMMVIDVTRKGATGDVLLNFRGEYTRFANPEDLDMAAPIPKDPLGGEIIGSKMNVFTTEVE